MNEKMGMTTIASALMVSSLVAPVLGQEYQKQVEEKGILDTKIYVQHQNTLEQIEERNITFSLYREGVLLGNILLNKPTTSLSSYGVEVKPLYSQTDSQEDSQEEKFLGFQIVVQGLDQGSYSVALSGKYHADYRSEVLEITDSSKELHVFTQGTSFTYGDFDGDGKVDGKDLGYVEADLLNGVHTHDVTGDGIVDISDLALLKMNLATTQSATILDTTILNLGKSMALEAMDFYWSEEAEVEGDISDLFVTGNENPVTLTPKSGEDISEENPLTIPLMFLEDMELAEIQLTTGTGEGALQEGFVTVTYEDEEGEEVTENILFSTQTPTTVDTLSTMRAVVRSSDSDEEENIIVISLGARVVVKTITVTVEQVEGDQFAVLREVNFVKDLVPENPDASNGIVTGFTATAGNESVKLTWNTVPNVSGYVVHYGTSKGKYTSSVPVNGTSLTVPNLDNFTTYYFNITSTQGDWSSGYGGEISAKPEPTSVPSATLLLEATPFDQGGTIRWQSNSNASSYKVYCKHSEDEVYYFAGTTTGTSLKIGELDNGEEYQVYVTGVNSVGEGAKSNVLSFVPEKEDLTGPTLPTVGRIPNSAITHIAMQDPSNVKNELYPNGFEVGHVADDDFSTDWVANLWYKSSTFTFTLDDAYDMSYLVYVGKLEGDYRSSLSHATVQLWTDEDDLEGEPSVTYTDASVRYTNQEGELFAVVDFPRNNVQKISVMMAQWNGSPTNVSLSEIVFYEHNEIDDNISALFSNDTYTALHSWVTQSHIDDLREEVENLGEYLLSRDMLHRELDLAESYLEGNWVSGLMLTDFVSIDNAKDDPSLSNISPLGVVGYVGQQITIYADIPEGETLQILPSQYFSEAFDHLGTAITLENGRNIITIEQLSDISSVTKGGPLYYRYTGNKGSEILLHIDSAYQSSGAVDVKVMPVLELYDFYSLTEYQRKVRISSYLEDLGTYAVQSINSPTTNPTNSTEISLRNVLLSLPATEVYSGLSSYITLDEKVEALYEAILAWEELLMVCNVAYGLDDSQNPREARQNIRYMRMSDTAFMYAGGNHIGVQYGSVASLVKGKPTSAPETGANSLYGWGIAHEIGHNLDRLGRVEITNNIYSLLAQTYDGGNSYGTSRLAGYYPAIYDKVTSGGMGIANNVFVQLGMYWQLQQAYCGENPLEFYNSVNKTYKNGLYTSYSGDERFAVAVSHVVERDLSSFFTAWGVALSETALSEMGQYREELRNIQYFNDDSREYRLEDATELASSEGILTAKSNSDNPKEVQLTFHHDFDLEQVLGFEWYRNGKLVGFSTSSTYADDLGGLNNTALEYSVKVIDALGMDYKTTFTAKEMRVEYDNILSSSLYSATKVEDSYKFTFKDATAVSGIIFSSGTTGTDFKVEIVGKEGDKVTAKEDVMTFLEGSSFHYFNKPNVDSEDTRIGVYDALEIWVTGIDSPDDVEFLGYIGDNVSFFDQAVGILAEDFDTGDGILEAGTMLVMGEYLGDPYFSEITLLGRFHESYGLDEEETYTERAFAGTTYLIGYDTETVSTISDGLFLFVPDVDNESHLQGHEEEDHDHESCTTMSIFPAELKAVLERTSDTGNYQTSDTVWISVPTEDSMPQVYID